MDDAMAQAKGVMDREAADREAQLAEAIPPATEPLDPAAIGALADAVARTVETLSGGQVELPPVQIPTEPGPLPPALGAQVLTLGGWLTTIPELEGKYEIDPMMLTTSSGITELGVMIDELGRDKSVQKLMNKPATAKPPEGDDEEEPPSEEADLDELIPPAKGKPKE